MHDWFFLCLFSDCDVFLMDLGLVMIKPELRSGFKDYESRIDNPFGLFFTFLFLFQCCVYFIIKPEVLI